MSKDNETVAQVCGRLNTQVSYAKIHYKTKKWIKEAICNILSLHSNEIEEERERRDNIIHGMTAEMENVRGEIAAKDEEIEKLKFEIMKLKSEQRTAGEVIVDQTNKVAAKDAEIARWREQALQEDAAAESLRCENASLRALVKEMADALECRLCDFGCDVHDVCPAGNVIEHCESVKFRALVAKAREVCK